MGACDAFKQNCPAMQKCDITCSTSGTPSLGCVTDSGGGKMHGEACGSGMACAKGNICLTSMMKSNCRKYCSMDSDCPTGKKCQELKITVMCGGADAGTDGGMPMITIKACEI